MTLVIHNHGKKRCRSTGQGSFTVNSDFCGAVELLPMVENSGMSSRGAVQQITVNTSPTGRLEGLSAKLQLGELDMEPTK